MRIIKPETSDLLRVLDLWNKQYEYHSNLDANYYISETENLQKTFEKYILDAINDKGPEIRVADKDGEIVGFVTFEIGEADYFATNIQRYGEIIELFVEEEYRDQGIGKLLITAAENYFRDCKIDYVKLQVSTFNINAIKIYEHLNYIDRQKTYYKKIHHELPAIEE